MDTTALTKAAICEYSLQVPINRPADAVWEMLSSNIDDWWMNDFRALGQDSRVTLDTGPGGALIETTQTGASLEWYRVQMCVPGESLHLVGYLAPDWGGPTTSMLKLALAAQGQSCILTVSDALLGNVTDSSANTAKEGWAKLFTEGLKKYAES